MRLYPRKKVNIIGIVLIALMLKASHWQWERHLEKQAYIKRLEARLEEPIGPLAAHIAEIQSRPLDFIHRRMQVVGEYDFENEMLLRNRRHEGFSRCSRAHTVKNLLTAMRI